MADRAQHDFAVVTEINCCVNLIIYRNTNHMHIMPKSNIINVNILSRTDKTASLPVPNIHMNK